MPKNISLVIEIALLDWPTSPLQRRVVFIYVIQKND